MEMDTGSYPLLPPPMPKCLTQTQIHISNYCWYRTTMMDEIFMFSKKREKHNKAVRWGKNKSRGYGSVAYNTEGSPIPGQASAVFHLCTVLLHHYNGLLLGCKWGGIWQNAIKAISKQFSQTDFFRAASGQLYWGNVVFCFPLPKSNNKRVTLPISQQQ